MSTISPQLLSRLLQEHGAALVLYAQQLCLTPEDVVQEAFVRLVEQPAVPGNVTAWLYRVVRNGALNASRATVRRQRHETAAAGEAWFESSLDLQLDAADATRALGRLAPAEREAIVARLWGGLSFEEIGEQMDTSTSTAYRHYQAGIDSLRERLGALCPEKTLDI